MNDAVRENMMARRTDYYETHRADMLVSCFVYTVHIIVFL
jgi:hypothetical protein